MHESTPYALSVQGGELTDRDQAFVQITVKRFLNLKNTAQLASLRRYFDLPDGGYFVVQHMGGIFKVIASKHSQSIYKEFTGYATGFIPMLFSGDISTARYVHDAKVSLVLSQNTRRRLKDYKSDQGLAPKSLSLRRFNIEPNDFIVPEFIDLRSSSIYSPTQYTQQHPTLYSGAMAEIMQIVGGYGRQSEILEQTDDYELKAMRLTDTYIDAIEEELDGIRLPGYTGLPDQLGQFQYDYKFSHTNTVCFDNHNQPWLVQVSGMGVYVMPLPIIAATKTLAFRRYIEEMDDQEILKILDRFGAMPSGESFPQDQQEFEAWRRAGVIIKVCDVADFYTHSAYFDGCGWSFNLLGHEGFNTCYDYDQQGYKVGYTYKIQLSLSAVVNNGWSERVEISGDDAIKIGRYLNQLQTQLNGDDPRTLAIQYKLRTVDRAEILARVDQNPSNMQFEFEYWDNYESRPIAVHSGNVSMVFSGRLHYPKNGLNKPEIKFPDYVLGGCLSFDFSPEDGKNPPAVNCDTIMFAYYVNNAIKVVKYFVDWREYNKQVTSDFEDVMTVGSWERTETVGLSSPQGYFYTSDFDLREVYAPITTTTRILGKDAGHDVVPFFEFYQFFGRTGRIWRNRYYTHKTTVTRSTTSQIKIAVCIPMYDRNCMLLAKQKDTTLQSVNESLNLGSVQDPYSYEYWTYDPVFAWIGALSVMKGKPYPVNGNPVWVEIEHYNPSPINDFADQGPWIVGLPNDYTWLIHPKSNEWLHSGGGYPPKVKEYSTLKSSGSKVEGGVDYSTLDQPLNAHKNVPDVKYFLPSPDPYVGLFYRDGCKVVFGDTEYASISEQNNHGKRANYGYTIFSTSERLHHFIGVINE